jgi:hypothetical protein
MELLPENAEAASVIMETWKALTIRRMNAVLEGQMVGHGEWKRRLTIIDLHHCLSALWNLLGLRDGESVLPHLAPRGGSGPENRFESRILSYIKNCYRRVTASPIGRESKAFVLAPHAENEPCLTACYFAFKIAERCKLLNESGSSHQDWPGFNEAISQSFDYVRASWNDRDGGFGYGPGSAAELVHTFCALKLHYDIADAFGLGCTVISDIDKKWLAIERFVGRCRKEGGYALLPEWWPSAYGTRLGLQILELKQRVSGEVRFDRPYEAIEFINSLKVYSNETRHALGFAGMHPWLVPTTSSESRNVA